MGRGTWLLQRQGPPAQGGCAVHLANLGRISWTMRPHTPPSAVGTACSSKERREARRDVGPAAGQQVGAPAGASTAQGPTRRQGSRQQHALHAHVPPHLASHGQPGGGLIAAAHVGAHHHAICGVCSQGARRGHQPPRDGAPALRARGTGSAARRPRQAGSASPRAGRKVSRLGLGPGSHDIMPRLYRNSGTGQGRENTSASTTLMPVR